MANRVKILIAVVSIVCAGTLALAIRYLGRDQDDCWGMASAYCALSDENQTLAADLSRSETTIREIARAELLLERLPDTISVLIDLPPTVADTFGAKLARELRQYAGDDSLRASVGVVVIPRVHGRSEVYPFSTRAFGPQQRIEVHTGTAGNVPYCITTVVADSGIVLETNYMSRYTSLTSRAGKLQMGPCYFWARHGAPGAHIDKWLRAGGYRFGTRESIADYPPITVARHAFNYDGEAYGNVHGVHCIDADQESCRHAVLDMPSNRYPMTAVTSRQVSAYNFDSYYFEQFAFAGAERVILAELERYYGPERFRAFWQSPADVETAFQAAFGKPLGQWVMEWAQAHFEDIPTGPRLDLNTVLLSLLTIALFVAMSVSVVRRRFVA
jgi:hypothetical protein